MTTESYKEDKRYTITRENNGMPTKQHIVRFSGKYISGHNTKSDAELAAQSHKDDRNMSLKFESQLELDERELLNTPIEHKDGTAGMALSKTKTGFNVIIPHPTIKGGHKLVHWRDENISEGLDEAKNVQHLLGQWYNKAGQHTHTASETAPWGHNKYELVNHGNNDHTSIMGADKLKSKFDTIDGIHKGIKVVAEGLDEAKNDYESNGFTIHPKNKNDISDHDVYGNPIVRYSINGGRKKSIQVPYSFRSSDTHGSPSELHDEHPIVKLVANHLAKKESASTSELISGILEASDTTFDTLASILLSKAAMSVSMMRESLLDEWNADDMIKTASKKLDKKKSEYECPYCNKRHDEPNASCCGEKGHVEKVEESTNVLLQRVKL